eukprot:435170-Prymnesium_polylepis.1
MCKNGAAIYPTRQLCCVFKIFAILRALGAAAHRTVVISTLSCRPSRGSIDESVCAVSGVLTSARRAARLRRCDELQRDACAVDGLEPVSPRADPRERARCAAPAADTTAERRASRCRRMGAALAPAQSHDARAGAAHRQRVWHRALLSGQRIDVPAVQGQRVLLLQVAGGGDDRYDRRGLLAPSHGTKRLALPSAHTRCHRVLSAADGAPSGTTRLADGGARVRAHTAHALDSHLPREQCVQPRSRPPLAHACSHEAVRVVRRAYAGAGEHRLREMAAVGGGVRVGGGRW